MNTHDNHIPSALARESLLDRDVMASTNSSVVKMLPEAHVIKIGGRSIIEAGREVMAIPGSPLDARSQGCNHLIREGAVLVQSVDDVVELLEILGFDVL